MDKNRTIEILKAKLKLMANFAEEAKKIGDEIADMFEWDMQDDMLWDILNEIQDCERPASEMDATVKELADAGLLKDWEQGEVLTNSVSVKFCNVNSLEIEIETGNGKISSYISVPDLDGSVEAGTIYYAKDQAGDLYPVDICTASVKKGELAEANKLPKDNEDIDVYVWSDPYSEDYTRKLTIPHNDIMNALDIDQNSYSQIRATNIEWDVDEDEDGSELPTTVIIPDEYALDSEYDEESLADAIGDWLSNEYEFCHNGFSLEFLNNEDLKAEEERLKRAINDAGVDAVEEFLGHPLDNDTTDIWSEMNDVIAQMPDEEYIKYLEKYL